MTIIEEFREIAQRKCNCYEVARMLGFECGGNQCTECIPRLIGSIADRIEAEQALPEGAEWPRFEDGEPVGFGDEVEYEDEVGTVACIRFEILGWSMTLNHNLDLSYLSGSYGERVKRPTPKVLDANGDPIEVGDTVWTVYSHRERVISAVNAPYVLISEPTVEYEGGGWDRAESVTHERPDSWECIEEDAAKRVCEYAGAQKSIADADRYTCLECPYDEPGPHTDAGCNERMRLDLVRRAKALAKAGEVE